MHRHIQMRMQMQCVVWLPTTAKPRMNSWWLTMPSPTLSQLRNTSFTRAHEFASLLCISRVSSAPRCREALLDSSSHSDVCRLCCSDSSRAAAVNIMGAPGVCQLRFCALEDFRKGCLRGMHRIIPCREVPDLTPLASLKSIWALASGSASAAAGWSLVTRGLPRRRRAPR